MRFIYDDYFWNGDFNIDFEGACAAAVAAAAGTSGAPNISEQETNEDGSALNISDVIDAIKIQDPQTAIEMFPSASGGMTQGGGNGAGNGADEPTLMDHTTYNGGIRSTQQTTVVNNKNNDNSQSTSPRRNQHPSGDNRNWKNTAYVKIVEQPASKALRFRYECEGRSAGSIPGVNSTHENKTYPTIEVVGYQGRAFVVVSCVTKDKPYRPHPHNLVGKDGCKRGVCTIEINSETMRAQFSNLGIQCVKKKDIESALIEREKIKVDPFRTGFAHRFQPSSIDLNAVRLCFQVFLEEKTGKFNIPLTPVVSNPIYDKKAMSDLIICKLCSCSSTVAGGKELILLCEKVAKEDISVRFFEEKNGQIIWEAYGDFQHTDVHKQTAISFRTPRYKDIHVERPVTVSIQLKRPSDGATSEALPFDFLPLDAGRRKFWFMHKTIKGKVDMEIFKRILSEDSESTTITKTSPTDGKEQTSEIINLVTPNTDEEKPIVSPSSSFDDAQRKSESEVDNIVKDIVANMNIEPTNVNQDQIADIEMSNDKTKEWIKSSEFERNDSLLSNASITMATTDGQNVMFSDEDKTLNDILDQVAELDEIYTDHVLRRDTFQNTIANELAGVETCMSKNTREADMEFDDAATETSLQKAFKNPITIEFPPTPPSSQIAPEDILNFDNTSDMIINPQCPIIDTNTPPSLKRSEQYLSQNRVEEEKLPPLPPKRIKKQDIEKQPLKESQNRQYSPKSSPVTLQRPQSQIIIMKTPDQSPPTKKLPPTPPNSNTLPKQKKPGFFSKLFSRRKSKSDLESDKNSLNSINSSTPVTSNSPQSLKASPEPSRDPSLNHFNINDPNRASVKSLQPPHVSKPPQEEIKNKQGKPVGRSVSSVSGKRPHLTPDIIHIPLKGDSFNSLPMNNEAYSNASTLTLSNHHNLDRKTVSALQLADIPIQDGNMELVAIADAHSLKNLCEGEFGIELHPSVDLTEAEHFALYTSIAPQATTSEFDETSCYYAPVDAGEILTPAEVAKRLAQINSSNGK
ncbi:embryonic polarity protein dorsal isoform X2 [Condylostylus longicornis]|uniref:embryonic polarity protein dorsal isoform X2 n=1 Tax=Condylostylus longicornis TaxID=2530218 RepID=UPI00244DAC84|nr:embryonic polarity protein dorsal isoform X2 [Condylostylus longicornis]